MEDMAWVLYALLGTQVILLFLIWRIGAAVVGEIKSVHDTLVDVRGALWDQTRILEKELQGNAGRAQSSQAHYEVLQDQSRELEAIRRLLEVQTRYFVED